MKGFLSNVLAELENGEHYLLNFIDPSRLAQDLHGQSRIGKPYFADPGMVVLQKVVVEKVGELLKCLLEDGFFDNLKPIELMVWKNKLNLE